MEWIRGHRRHGAFLAFAALALQIVLSFGHVHLDHVRLDDVRPVHAGANAPHGATFAVATHRAPAQAPDGDDDYCAICASIYLVSTSVIAQAPLLPVPLAYSRIEHSTGVARGSAARSHVAFRSRAPPAA